MNNLLLGLMFMFFFNSIVNGQTFSGNDQYKNCIEYLEYRRSAILNDTLGQSGAKLSAAEYILEKSCNFHCELFPVIKYYFGEPDVNIDWDENGLVQNKGLTFKYLLYKPSGKNSTGMKWLYIRCTKNYVISSIEIYIVDE